MPLNPDTM